MAEKTTAKVKKGVAYYEGSSFSLSNTDKVKIVDFSKYAYVSSLSFTRNGNNLLVNYSGRTVTINDFFNAKGGVASSVKTIRVYDYDTKKKYKDYNLVTSGLLNDIDSGVENFSIKKGVITGTAFADTISAENFNKPSGKKKDTGVTIKTGAGNDYITGSTYNDTFNITGSGKKVFTIENNDGNDIITGVSTSGAITYLNYTDFENIEFDYKRDKNNLVIERTYTEEGEEEAEKTEKTEKTATTTIKDYFKSTTVTPDVRFGDGTYSYVNLSDTLEGFDAGAKGTHLSDIITGTKKADKITTGSGNDTIKGGLGNDTITVNGSGLKTIIMNAGDGVDTVNIKNNSAAIGLQFNGLDMDDLSTLTCEKSGKNDIKITNKVETNAEIAPTGYVSNTGFDSDKISYFYACGSYSYFTEITEDTGLYSYEVEGETRYSAEKIETEELSTATLIRYSSGKNQVGWITNSEKTINEYKSSSYSQTPLSDSGIDTLYAYKCTNCYGDSQYAYSTIAVLTNKWSDLYLHLVYKDDGEYKLVNESNKQDGDIAVKDQTVLYRDNYDNITLEKPKYGAYQEISKNDYDSIYYIDAGHEYVTAIGDNGVIYKTYDISTSYYLSRTSNAYYPQGIAVATEVTKDSYTKINTIYKTTDSEGNILYSITEPEGFEEKIESSSVIIKNYLTKDQSVDVTNSEFYSSKDLSSILQMKGLNMGNATSKKAQTLTGSNFNDNIVGGSGKDKITTGASSSYYGRGDIITPGKGNDTITINGDGKKTINISNADGNDTIIFTDNNKKTKYDYTSNKMLYLNYDEDAEITYNIKGKDLVVNRSYINGTKTATATTTLKNYFNVDYKYQLAHNIIINDTSFDASTYFNNTTIDKSKDKNGKAVTKKQTINGNMFDNKIIGGSGNDTINGYGGSDILDGGKGSDTYIVNYNKSGSKHYLYDKIVISDSGTGAKDVDILKLDVKKKDMALLFNVNKITDSSQYTANDIIVGDNHYSYDNQLMIFADIEHMYGGVSTSSDKLTSSYGIIADGLEKITTSDKKTITLNNIRQIAQSVASWLSTANGGNGYDSTAAAWNTGSEDFVAMLAKYNPDNATIKETLNMK